MGFIGAAGSFTRAAWSLSLKLVEDGSNPIRIMQSSARFNGDLDRFYKKMNALPVDDSAATQFKDRLLNDAINTFQKQGERAFFATSISVTLAKITSHAEAIKDVLPNHPSSKIILQEARGLQDGFEALENDTKSFIDADIRGHKESCPMKIMTDFVIDEANRLCDMSAFLRARTTADTSSYTPHAYDSGRQPSRQVRRAQERAADKKTSP